ncbi:MAG: monofunctional biosynthetic peptidoglycan transglycosylase [Bdellovibrionales bacterium]|nr:monofunctional biosynthetic peptidoglycan transglycosylase [Bdellovibrionales bacterium]
MKGLWRKPLFKYLVITCLLLMLFSPLYMYFSHDVSVLNSQYPHIKVAKDLTAEVEFKKGKPSHWVNLNQISPYGKWAIVLSEDWSFYQHEGVDLEQMKVALSEMMEDKRFRGASTITQQMVKNVFLSEFPTLWRKFHEILIAQKVEKTISKNRILEIYLNSIEYGPGIYGIKAAAKHYFKKAPSQISPREGAFLAMLLPSPKRYYVSFQKKKLTKFAQFRVKAILKKLRMGKVISPEVYEIEINRKLAWEN